MRPKTYYTMPLSHFPTNKYLQAHSAIKPLQPHLTHTSEAHECLARDVFFVCVYIFECEIYGIIDWNDLRCANWGGVMSASIIGNEIDSEFYKCGSGSGQKN